MALFSGIGSKVKSRVDALRNRANKKALVAPKQVAAKPVAPKITTKQVDWEAPEMPDELNIHEQLINSKRNRAHNKRMAMKKFHHKQAKMNKQYRVRC